MEKFTDLTYKRPDYQQLEKLLNEKIDALQNADSYDQALAAFKDIEQADISAQTMSSLAHIRNTIDTNDSFYDAEAKANQAGMSRLTPVYRRRNEVILQTPFRKEFEEEFGSFLFYNLEQRMRLLDPRLIEDRIEENELVSRYQKVTAQCICDFRGEKCNFYGLLKHMQSTDRQERKEAFEAWAKMYEDIGGQLDDIYTQLVVLRSSMAEKLNMNYTDMAYLSRGRYCYGPEEAAAFRKQVKEVIVPLVSELYEKQRERLQIAELEYYDEELIFAQGNEMPKGNKDEMVAAAQQMYRQLSAETGEFFDFMVENELFDLESKPGKRMGGYCTSLPEYKAPFIFSNFNGTAADVDVLTHEAGHAFQGYLSSRTMPLLSLTHSTSEINEIHSMSMEHFTYPWMNLFFSDADKYRYAHLWGALKVIPYMVCVDEFQHRIYEKPQMNAQERKQIWHEIEKYYMPWRHYDGNAFLEEGGFWMQKQHIFMYPFYYLDYALAQMGAFDFYIRDRKDHQKAWNDYLKLCRLGGSRHYFELLEAAQLHNPFKEGSVQQIISDIAEILHQYDH